MTTEVVLGEIKKQFERESGLTSVESRIASTHRGPVLVLEVAFPTERLFEILESARKDATGESVEAPLATLHRSAHGNLLDRPEGRLLLRTLSESQNVNRFSFAHDFMSRYTRSVFGAESQITASANHVVLGRRGAGKSMLLLYALHEREKLETPSIWIDMQVYSSRGDDQVISEVIREILEQSTQLLQGSVVHNALHDLLNVFKTKDLDQDKVRQFLPDIRRLFADFSARSQELFIFLDDFHVVEQSLQPTLLDILYAFSRGNRIFLKLSAIETLARTFDPGRHLGLQIPQDSQLIKLDYNLTIPDKATEHIETILNSHARYSGLPSIRRLCTSGDVIPRLTWVAAGVPRDAMNLFSQAVTKASLEGRRQVSVSNVNIAASEALGTKLSDLETDASQKSGSLKSLLGEIQQFCVTEQRQNAFLIEIREDSEIYDNIRNLVHLRLLHVISEGVSIGRAGRRYLGIVLDYGFYTGVRTARSVDLFNQQSKRVSRSSLRKLPVFSG